MTAKHRILQGNESERITGWLYGRDVRNQYAIDSLKRKWLRILVWPLFLIFAIVFLAALGEMIR
ncbi:MAG: hypothetical protein JXA73_08925 [Acidobacteria bacterium]|nr:hypothetical protein [Acidobacteriota bacterium]